VFATIQERRDGINIAAAVPNVGQGTIATYLNKAVRKKTKSRLSRNQLSGMLEDKRRWSNRSRRLLSGHGPSRASGEPAKTSQARNA
jgi:hypothetical protein